MASAGALRILLIEPHEPTRLELRGLLETLGNVWVVAACDSFEAGAAAAAAGGAVADALLVGLDGDPEAACAFLAAQAAAHPRRGLLPVAHSQDGGLILRAIRAGAREFLPLPTAAGELRDALARVAPAPGSAAAEAGSGRLLAVLGGAGGVGCTTLAANLAASLAGEGKHETVLVDFDLLFGAVDVCLDLRPEQTLADLAHSVDRLDLTLVRRALIRHSSGLHVLPAPRSLDDAARLDPEAIRRVLEGLCGIFPTVVVDLSRALQPADWAALEQASAILLVVTLDPAGLRNTARLLDLLGQFDGMAEKVRVVANQVGASPYEVGVRKAEELLHRPVAWQIPSDPKVFGIARSRGTLLAADAPGSRPHRAILEIAREFGGEPERTRGRFGRIAASFF
jgi:pilus assembly protein CpaE